jgi:LPS-assembly protein
LNYAVFTPCPICDEEGRPKTPSISIQAQRVTQDEALRAILYQNAVFKVGGVPVLYLPVFAHPDPTVQRASGLLIPDVGFDEERGFSWEQPYLLVISPSEDWLFSPQINTGVEPFLNVQWRRRFGNGAVTVRGGYTYARNFGDFDVDDDGIDDVPQPLGRESRSYLLANGAFDPAGPWRWGFTLERTSDKTLFDRYDVRDPYTDNGLYHGDERRLISQVFAERQTARSYLSIAAFDIQSLRVAIPNEAAPGLNVFESDGALPVVAPMVDARWEPGRPILGGRLRLSGSAVATFRDTYVGAPVLGPTALPLVPAAGQGGVDTRRVTGRAEWRRTFLSPAGVRWEPFIDARMDLYSIGDLPAPGLEADQTVSRGRFTAGLDVSWPLIRPLTGGSALILEPMAQLSASSRSDLDPRIPNEDSQTLDLDETSLFRIDRFPGQDLYEGGLRVTGGARATVRWSDVRQASVFVGRSWRDEAEPGLLTVAPDSAPGAPVTYDAGGLAGERSDWIVQASFAPHDGIRTWGRASIDDSGEVRRAEGAVEGRWGPRNAGSLLYVRDRSNPVAGPLNRNYAFIQASGQQFVTGNWGVTGTGVMDLDRDLIVRSEIGLLFDDDCLRFELGWRRDNTRVRPSGPSEGVYVRLTLATFGGTGYQRGEGGR